MVSTKTLVGITAVSLAAVVYNRYKINDLEGKLWSFVPPELAHFIRSKYITARIIQLLFNNIARLSVGLTLLLTRPTLLYTHVYPPHQSACSVPYFGRHLECVSTYRTRHQVLDIYTPSSSRAKGHPVLIFVHGGIWTLFTKEYFRLLGEKFAERGICCVIPSYSYYPDGTVLDQIQDVSHCVQWTAQNIARYGGNPGKIVLGGQSSGAHVTSQYLLRHPTAHLLCGYCGISGVYDPLQHNLEWESRRGVNHISPLVPANGGLLRWEKSKKRPQARKEESGTETKEEEPMLQYSSCRRVTQLSDQEITSLPRILLIHGTKDTTVPVSSSQQFYDCCKKTMRRKDDLDEEKKSATTTKNRISIALLNGVDHATYLYEMSIAKSKGAEGNIMMDTVVNFVVDVAV